MILSTRIAAAVALCVQVVSLPVAAQSRPASRSPEYAALQHRLAAGWNTWNTRSVLSHVLLPDGFAVNLGIKEYAQGGYLKEALIGRMAPGDEQITAGLHAYDGSYTDLTLRWRAIEVRVQSATIDGELVVLVTSSYAQRRTPLLVVESGFLWNRRGELEPEGDALVGRTVNRTTRVYGTKEGVAEPYVSAQTPYLAMPMDGPLGISTGRKRSIEEIQVLVADHRRKAEEEFTRFGSEADVARAIQTVLAWDTIYDPLNDRVVSPVSRIWNLGWEEGNVGEQSNAGEARQYLGLVLFGWDTYFAALMASLGDKELAYANIVEVTKQRTAPGFVPQWYRSLGAGIRTEDRSDPPIGSIVVREVFRRHGDRWLLAEVFDDLLAWNRWWPKARLNKGFLSWGSIPYEPVVGFPWETRGVDDRFGAALESGMDNLPAYDDIPFNKQTHLLEVADVALMSLYVADCDALSEIAGVLGRAREEVELRDRAAAFRGKLGELWSEKDGIFLLRRTDTNQFVRRLSPISFYPLLARAATRQQAERMIREHLDNPKEFGGDWIIPATARDDPAYKDNYYWRGRIWPPMNLLVYLGLRNYDLTKARTDLAEKSKRLLMAEWLGKGHVHENYNADSGDGDDVTSSDRFYHWGGLLGIPILMEKGLLPGSETPLRVR
jgi:hypothetical protein